MNQLQVSNALTIDSREVAEMVEKQHSELLKDMRRYTEYLNEGNFHLVDFFTATTYTDAKGETRPNYQVTKKGCEFIAHKLTGQKGAIFTATYINKFHAMEAALKKDSYMIDDPIERAKAWIKEQEEKQKLLTDNATLDTENKLLAQENLKWADRKLIEALVKKYGGKIGYAEAWRDFKKELLYKHGININSRLTNQINKTGKKSIKTLSMIHDEELAACISTAVALCKSNHVLIEDILSKYQEAS